MFRIFVNWCLSLFNSNADPIWKPSGMVTFNQFENYVFLLHIDNFDAALPHVRPQKPALPLSEFRGFTFDGPYDYNPHGKP